MLVGYTVDKGALRRIAVTNSIELVPEIRWLDLNNPTEQERQWVRAAYGQELQFLEELSEIEASARYYRDESGLHLNLYFLNAANGSTRNVNVAFTVNDGRLYTLHADDVPELRAYYQHASAHPELDDDPLSILLGIVDLRVGLLADTYERLQTELETLGRELFRVNERSMTRVIETLARIEDTNGKARLAMLENQRAFSRLLSGSQAPGHADVINEVLRDIDSLLTHANGLSERIKFLMDSALGLINLAHSKRLNIFTVLSVILMPPTLIASIYGMNFHHMPELDWLWGYPLALAVMLAVAVVPMLYLKRRGWL
jgi:magnesium transporter